MTTKIYLIDISARWWMGSKSMGRSSSFYWL